MEQTRADYCMNYKGIITDGSTSPSPLPPGYPRFFVENNFSIKKMCGQISLTDQALDQFKIQVHNFDYEKLIVGFFSPAILIWETSGEEEKKSDKIGTVWGKFFANKTLETSGWPNFQSGPVPFDPCKVRHDVQDAVTITRS